MQRNSDPNLLRIRFSYVMLEQESFSRVGTFDFEALGAVVRVCRPDVVQDVGGEEEMLGFALGPGAIFVRSEGFGVEVDAEAVV